MRDRAGVLGFHLSGARATIRWENHSVAEPDCRRRIQYVTHEVAHRLLLHTHERRAETTESTRETEAEAVAFVICEATGLNSLAAVPCDLRRRYTAPMTQEASELLKKALALSTDERAQLVDSLLESLDERHEDPAAVEAAWNDEIARRIAELESGKAKTIPWEEVRQRISAKLTNGR